MDRNPPINREERDILTPCQQTVTIRSLQSGSKSTNHSELCDPLTPLNSKTTATLIDGRENITVGGDLNFRFRMLLKGAVSLVLQYFTVKPVHAFTSLTD